MQTVKPMNRCGFCGQEWWDAHCCPTKLTGAAPQPFDNSRTITIGGPLPPDVRDAEIARLRAFRDFFTDRCEMLFFHFGMEAVELFNRCQDLTHTRLT